MTRSSINNADDLGKLIRKIRKANGLRQKEAAAFCNVGVRFLSDIENGKPTAHIGKTLQVLHRLGIDLYAEEKGTQVDTHADKKSSEFGLVSHKTSADSIAEYKNSLRSYLNQFENINQDLSTAYKELVNVKITNPSLTSTTALALKAQRTEILKTLKNIVSNLQTDRVYKSNEYSKLVAAVVNTTKGIRAVTKANPGPEMPLFITTMKEINDNKHSIQNLIKSMSVSKNKIAGE